MIEAVRAGTIFASDGKQYQRWRQGARRRSSGDGKRGGLTGQALEAAVMGLAARHPEYVVFGGA